MVKSSIPTIRLVRRIVLITVLYTTGLLSGIAQTLEINEQQDEKILFLNQLEYLIDSTNTLSFQTISSTAFENHFLKHDSYKNKDFRVNASYWLRIPVHHISNTDKIWLFEFYDQTIDQIEAYVPVADGSYANALMGDQYPFSKRKFAHKNFEIQLNMSSDTVAVYYFRVRSHEFADIRIAFRSVDRFINYALNEYFLYGTFYGMILIISLYNFLVYLAIREIKNIYYIFYILSVALYAMSLDGIGFQYLWPNHAEWNDYAIGISLYSLILWALIFTRRFLSTRANAPILDKALKAMIIYRSAVFLIELFFFKEFFAFRAIEIVPLSLIFYTGMKVWLQGYRPARFFVIAYGLLLLGFFIRTLVYFNILSLTTLSHYSLHLSFVIEMLFLTFALGDRITILKDNRDRALRRIIHQHEVNMNLKDKVNRELEEKVGERTIALNRKNGELEEINQKLIQQKQEINQINSILDLDNWKLKNRIKEVLEERLQEKVMDYKEFKTLYPDTLSCYRFLEMLKWEKGFQCRKCGNEKHFDGAQKFAKRCTRCGYNESITSYTIFQGIKFPIEKAFYIAYVAVSGKKELTLEILSTDLDLRTNTIWSFKRKVMESIRELEHLGNRPSTHRWEEVIRHQEEAAKSIGRGKKLLQRFLFKKPVI